MQAERLSLTLWDLLVTRLSCKRRAPVAAADTEQNLAVSIEVDLRIDKETKVDIAHIAFTLPLNSCRLSGGDFVARDGSASDHQRRARTCGDKHRQQSANQPLRYIGSGLQQTG